MINALIQQCHVGGGNASGLLQIAEFKVICLKRLISLQTLSEEVIHQTQINRIFGYFHNPNISDLAFDFFPSDILPNKLFNHLGKFDGVF